MSQDLTGDATLLSPEAVEFDLPIAGPAGRMLAYVIDFVVILAIYFAVIVVGSLLFGLSDWMETVLEGVQEVVERQAEERAPAEAGGDGDESHEHTHPARDLESAFVLLGVLVVILAFIDIAYFVFWETVTRGRTPGKSAVGLRVVDRSGLPPDLRTVLVRNVMRIADQLPMNYGFGLVSMIISPRGQRLGDHVAGTLVVRTDRHQVLEDVRVDPALEPLSLTREQLARLGAKELILLRRTLRRASQAARERRLDLLEEVSQSFCTRLELDPALASDPERFLQRLLLAAERAAQQN